VLVLRGLGAVLRVVRCWSGARLGAGVALRSGLHPLQGMRPGAGEVVPGSEAAGDLAPGALQ